MYVYTGTELKDVFLYSIIGFETVINHTNKPYCMFNFLVLTYSEASKHSRTSFIVFIVSNMIKKAIRAAFTV